MKKHFEFSIPVSVDAAVATYKSTAFFIDTMKLAGARTVDIVEEETRSDGGRRWKARITDTAKLPEFLRTSDIVVIVNESEFHPSSRTLYFRIMPSVRLDLIRLTGEIHIEEDGPHTKLHYLIDLKISIPIIGKKTEGPGIQIIGKECKKQAAFLAERASFPSTTPSPP